MSESPKKLRRSRRDRMIAGVCGGLAEYLSIDSTIVRIGFALLVVIPNGVGLLVYLIMMIVVPEEAVSETTPSSSDNTVNTVRVVNGQVEVANNTSWLSQRRNIFGLAIIFLGVSSLIRVLIPDGRWVNNLFWPLLVILIGGYLIFTTKRK
jgi:phage shock protein C